ncbi:uncharacterized protein LOC123472265 [Daphnia magna]|uniref:uncharacterized protein LOC123472265 n=1 Tax=Daphnia magna TaxID=35525 RepID=UPI001E1BD473|nr:uncharacterized protein LOC123472265 [Daphnia magna]
MGCSESINILLKLTFEGRRKIILDGEYTDIYDIMKRHCPVLNQANYLHVEFEMYVGKEVREFMAKWSEYVPLILKVAKKSALNNEKIRKLVDFYRRTSDINECFDTKSCAALELLPLLLPVRNKKNINAADFIYCAKEESASITDVLKESKGRGPFILHIEDNFHIIADCQSFCRSTNSSEALLNLFACIYVFNIAYNKEALN